MQHQGVGIIVLAAGLGKRMRSQTSKVLHEIGGKPLIFYVLHQILEACPNASVAVVVGYARESVESFIRAEPLLERLSVTFVHQADPQGTGHAARCAMESAWGLAQVRQKSCVLVLPGDLPLLSADLIRSMCLPLGKLDVLRLLTCELQDPEGYGRVVRRGQKGPVTRIVEQKDASLKEKQLHEVAASIYLFRANFLKESLKRLSNHNAQREYYLTDLIQSASRARKKMDVLVWKAHEDLRGVNDLWEMTLAARSLNLRWMQQAAISGVRFLDVGSTFLDFSVQLQPGVTIHPGVILQGKTTVGAHAVIGPHSVLIDTHVGEGVVVKTGTVSESASIHAHAIVGPYAHLRPHSSVGASCKIGNFVELKNARIGEKTNVAHLSYIGDAEVGSCVNIGCGFITCNFDGRVVQGERKHRTIIEDDVFMGSDCQVLAPIRVGKGAYVASGSTVTEDVAPGALAIARTRQVNKPGYAKKLRSS